MNNYLCKQIKWLLEKQAKNKSICEGKRESPQGNKIKVFLPAHGLHYGSIISYLLYWVYYFLSPLLSYVSPL